MITTAEKLMRVANDPGATDAERRSYREKAAKIQGADAGEFYYIMVRRYKSREDFNRSAKTFEQATTSGHTVASSIAAMGEYYQWKEGE